MIRRYAPVVALAVLAASAGLGRAQTLDRYGAPPQGGYAAPATYAPPTGPTAYPPIQAYAPPQAYAAPAYPQPIHSAPPLRQLSWPGKEAAAEVTAAPQRVAYTAPTRYQPSAPSPYGQAAYAPSQNDTAGGPRRSLSAYASPAQAYSAPPPSYNAAPVAYAAPAPRQATYPGDVAAMPPPQPPAYARAYVGDPRTPTPPLSYAPAYPAAGAGAPGAPGAPASAYAAPAPQPVQAVGGGTSRLYSVHREYGLTPDPAPVPPQFFGPTADLGEPETPDPALAKRATTTAGKTLRTNAVVAEGPSA